MSKINKTEKFLTFGARKNKLINSDPRSRAWVEVNYKAIENNSRVLKNFIGKDCLLMAVVNLVGDIDGVWWVVLVVDSGDEHFEDDESNNIRISNSTLTIDSSSPPPAGDTLPGCDNPQTDGDFESDAAATRSSAHHLGANANLTLDGCLIGLDVVDWYAIVIDSGNRTSIALSAEGAHLEIAVLNGSGALGQGIVDDDVRRVTISALNDDLDGVGDDDDNEDDDNESD